jgi:hypothetical protein
LIYGLAVKKRHAMFLKHGMSFKDKESLILLARVCPKGMPAAQFVPIKVDF